MIAVALVLGVAVPYALMLLFHGSDRADARGRRVSHVWRSRRRRR